MLTVELASIQRACRSLDFQPAITYCLLQSNHHTRFFQGEQRGQDRSGNPLPGLVVDQTIINPNYFDFFLLSHAGIQGTSRPTYYCVLWDASK